MGWKTSLKSLFGDRIAPTLETTLATTLTILFVRSDMEAFANIHLDKTIQNTTNPLEVASETNNDDDVMPPESESIPAESNPPESDKPNAEPEKEPGTY